MNRPRYFSKIYENLLNFAQVIEGYKGSFSKIYKSDNSGMMNESDFNSYL